MFYLNKIQELGVKSHKNTLQVLEIRSFLPKYQPSLFSQLVKPKDTGLKKPIDRLTFVFDNLELQDHVFLTDDQMVSMIFILLQETKAGSTSSKVFEALKEKIGGEAGSAVFNSLNKVHDYKILTATTYNIVMNMMKSQGDMSRIQKKGWSIDCNRVFEYGLKKLDEKNLLSELSFIFFCMGYIYELTKGNVEISNKNNGSLDEIIRLIETLETNKMLEKGVVEQFYTHSTSYPILKEYITLVAENEACNLIVFYDDNTDTSFYKKGGIPEAIRKKFQEAKFCENYSIILHIINNEAYIHWNQDYEILNKKLDLELALGFGVMKENAYWSKADSANVLNDLQTIIKAEINKDFTQSSSGIRLIKEVITLCGISPREKNAISKQHFASINKKIELGHFTNDENVFDFFRLLKVFVSQDIFDKYPRLLEEILNRIDGKQPCPYQKLVGQIVLLNKNEILRDDVLFVLLEQHNSPTLFDALIELNNYSICNEENVKKLFMSSSRQAVKAITSAHLEKASAHNKETIYYRPKEIYLSVFSIFHQAKNNNTLANLALTCKEFKQFTDETKAAKVLKI